MSRLSVRLLGGFGLERDGEVIILTASRAQAVLAYLLLHRDRSHERAWLASVLWPDTDERQARTNLRQALHHLRRTVPDAERCFVLDGQRLRVREGAPLDLDVARFEDTAAYGCQADDAGAITRSEREQLEDAVRHYRGDLLPEMEDDWLDEPREHLLERFASVPERIVDAAEAQRDYGAAVRHAQRWVQHDPPRRGTLPASDAAACPARQAGQGDAHVPQLRLVAHARGRGRAQPAHAGGL